MDEATYEPMPANRAHGCHSKNPAGIPTDWIEYDPDQGFELQSTNAYGDGSIACIDYCPWCGVLLMQPEIVLRLSRSGLMNRRGIFVLPREVRDGE